MTKQEIIKRMLPVVANAQWDRLEDYLNFRKDELLSTLETSTDIRQINKTQGQIAFLKEVLNLPEVIKSIK